MTPGLLFGPHPCNAFALTPGLPSSWPATLQPLSLGREPKAKVATAMHLGSFQEDLGRLESARGHRPLLAIHSTRGRLPPNERTTLPGSLLIMLMTSLTLGNLLTFFITFFSITSGPRGAKGTSVTSTLSKKSSFRLGWPPLRSKWPPGKPLDLTAPPKTSTFNLESS